jgi:hypothetical protein
MPWGGDRQAVKDKNYGATTVQLGPVRIPMAPGLYLVLKSSGSQYIPSSGGGRKNDSRGLFAKQKGKGQIQHWSDEPLPLNPRNMSKSVKDYTEALLSCYMNERLWTNFTRTDKSYNR